MKSRPVSYSRRLDRKPNHVVLVGDPSMLGSETFGMIPGLQLVDADFVLRYDSAGRSARHDLWRELIPGLAPALDEVAAGSPRAR